MASIVGKKVFTATVRRFELSGIRSRISYSSTFYRSGSALFVDIGNTKKNHDTILSAFLPSGVLHRNETVVKTSQLGAVFAARAHENTIFVVKSNDNIFFIKVTNINEV